MSVKLDKYWAGTEESLNELMLNIGLSLKTGQSFGGQQQAAQETSRLLSKQGSVGVIRIAGALTNVDTGYGSYMTTYTEIRDAMVQASVSKCLISLFFIVFINQNKLIRLLEISVIILKTSK